MIKARTIQQADISFLWDMLYEAALVSPEMQKISKKEVLHLSDIKKYVENWGKRGDAGIIVEVDENKVGAAWYRLFEVIRPGYGFVSPTIPELSIGVVPEERGKGYGTILIDAALKLAKNQQYEGLSLSVDRKNRAYDLYTKFGFVDAGISKPTDTSVTLVKYV